MRRAVIGIGILILLLGICGYYFNQAAECFGSTGEIELSQVKEAQKGQPIVPKFKMLRIAAPGCFKGHSSDSYKDLSCGYRVGGSGVNGNPQNYRSSLILRQNTLSNV